MKIILTKKNQLVQITAYFVYFTIDSYIRIYIFTSNAVNCNCERKSRIGDSNGWGQPRVSIKCYDITNFVKPLAEQA